MNLTAEQLAELLAGIARAQNAIVDAVERANGGWRNTHLIPILSIAANVRVAEPRLVDLPSRILLRSQGRGPVEIATIKADLERLIGEGASAANPVSAAAPPQAGSVAPAAPQAAGGSELDFSKPS